MRTTRFRQFAAVLLLVFDLALMAGSRAAAQPVGAGAESVAVNGQEAWTGLLAEGLTAGIDPQELDCAVRLLRGAPFAPTEAQQILEPTFAAAQQELPTEILLDKIAEGVGKGVFAPALIRVQEQRLALLQQAQDLLRANGYDLSVNRGRCLISATALALERGLSPTLLTEVVRLGGGRRTGKMCNVIEGGEVLHLAGINSSVVAQLMRDFVDKGLQRPAVLQAVRWAVEQKKTGMADELIPARLWKEMSFPSQQHEHDQDHERHERRRFDCGSNQ